MHCLKLNQYWVPRAVCKPYMDVPFPSHADGVPSDGHPRTMTVGMEVWLTVIMYTLAVAGIVLTTLCILFTIYFRKTK